MSVSTQDRLIEAAHQIFLRDGAIPIGFGEVAECAGVSRTLVYAHFSCPAELVNAVLDHQADILEQAGIADIDPAQDVLSAITQALTLYYDHLNTHGSLLHAASQDTFMAGQLSPAYSKLRNTALVKLSRIAMRDLDLSPKLGLGLIILAASLGEEAARLVRAGKTSREMGKDVMIRSATRMLEGLTPES